MLMNPSTLAITILIFFQRDGAAFLETKAKKYMHQLGSLFSPFYFYRDIYMHLFINGGKTLQEVLVPNLNFYNMSGSPTNNEFQFDLNAQQIQGRMIITYFFFTRFMLYFRIVRI